MPLSWLASFEVVRRDSLVVRDPSSYVAYVISALIVQLFKLGLCEGEIKLAWPMAFAIISGTPVDGPLDLHAPYVISDEHVVFGHGREHASAVFSFSPLARGRSSVHGFVAEWVRARKFGLDVSHVSHFVDIVVDRVPNFWR